jgi:hypothetical protein
MTCPTSRQPADGAFTIITVTAKRGDDRCKEWETLTEGASAGILIYWNDVVPAEAYFTTVPDRS